MLSSLVLSLLTLTTPPEVELERLMLAPHGLTPAFAARARIDCADPAGLQMVITWADPARVPNVKRPLEKHKILNALGMLFSVCGTKGHDLAVARLRDTRAQRDKAWSKLSAMLNPKATKPDPLATALFQEADWLATMERLLLWGAAASKDDALVPDLLPRVQTDEPMQLEMIAYFAAVARGRADVKTELLKLRSNTKSKPLIDAIDAWLALKP